MCVPPSVGVLSVSCGSFHTVVYCLSWRLCFISRENENSDPNVVNRKQDRGFHRVCVCVLVSDFLWPVVCYLSLSVFLPRLHPLTPTHLRHSVSIEKMQSQTRHVSACVRVRACPCLFWPPSPRQDQLTSSTLRAAASAGGGAILFGNLTIVPSRRGWINKTRQ